jgi:hypothetical protein
MSGHLIPGDSPSSTDVDPVAEIIALRPGIVRCLTGLGWDRLLGKSRGGSQTLLEHTLAVFDVLLACLPFLVADSYPRLTRDEVGGMALAVVAHDAGKAQPEFQGYLRGQAGAWTEHVKPELIESVVRQVAAGVGIDLGNRLHDILSGAMLHDRRMRRERGELAEWERAHLSSSWRKLADAVNYADSLASAADLMAAEDFLRRTPQLVARASVASYRVRVRGVSTTFLHEAALEAFERAGWRPIVYFAEGTIFASTNAAKPTREHVEASLSVRLEQLLDERRNELPDLAVGGPTEDFLPRPEYVRRDGLRLLWSVAARRVGRQKDQNDEKKAQHRKQWRRAFPDNPDPTAADLEVLRDVGPEACSFKLAKCIFQRVLDEAANHHVKQAYESLFGSGAFDALLRQSTFMAVEDYKLCVKRWHALPGIAIGEPNARTVGEIEPQRRVERLIDLLVEITESAIKVQTAPLPSDTLIKESVARMMVDLAMDTPTEDRAAVDLGLAGYLAFKSAKRDKNGPQQCVQCAALIGAGQAEAASAALGNIGSFSNRRAAYDSSAGAPVCRVCTTDLKLGQLSLGGTVEVVIAVVPRRSLGPEGAHELVRRARELRAVVDRQLSPETMNPTKYVALSFPTDLLRSWRAAADLPNVLLRPVSPDKRKERCKKLEKELTIRLGEAGLEDINGTYGTAFGSVPELAQALMDQKTSNALRKDSDVKASLTVMTGGQIDFAAVTPNLVTVALESPLGAKDDKAADRALCAFGLATLFALHLDAAVFVGPVRELRPALASRAGRGVYVPANAPARRILGGDWLDFLDAERWLAALQAAIALKGPTSAQSLLEILKYPSAGFAVRRVEQRSKNAPFWPELWRHIEALKEVLG